MSSPLHLLSVGGSLLVPDDVRSAYAVSLRDLLASLPPDNKCIIFCGGGATARRYQQAIRDVGEKTDAIVDWMGIYASILNAHYLRLVFGAEAEEEIMTDPQLVVPQQKRFRIGAGWKPGHSTDYDAVRYAVSNGISRVINLTNIPYIYDKDPRTHADAAPRSILSYQEAQDIVGTTWSPGMHAPFDPIALALAAQHRITIVIADGQNLENIKNILEEKEFQGTTIGL